MGTRGVYSNCMKENPCPWLVHATWNTNTSPRKFCFYEIIYDLCTEPSFWNARNAERFACMLQKLHIHCENFIRSKSAVTLVPVLHCYKIHSGLRFRRMRITNYEYTPTLAFLRKDFKEHSSRVNENKAAADAFQKRAHQFNSSSASSFLTILN